jgi:hypothetical protein
MTPRVIEATFSDGHTDSVLAAMDDLNLAQQHLLPINDDNQRLLKLVADAGRLGSRLHWSALWSPSHLCPPRSRPG